MPAEPVKLSTLVTTAPETPIEITPAERDEFLRAVECAMDRLGFIKANETTDASERLSEQDFSVRINAR